MGKARSRCIFRTFLNIDVKVPHDKEDLIKQYFPEEFLKKIEDGTWTRKIEAPKYEEGQCREAHHEKQKYIWSRFKKDKMIQVHPRVRDVPPPGSSLNLVPLPQATTRSGKKNEGCQARGI